MNAASRVSSDQFAVPSRDDLVIPLRVHQPSSIHLVVIVPALNESKTIADVVRRIPRSIDGVSHVDVVVVDDGSTDNTGELARTEGAIVVRHPRPCGVGAAFQSGLRKVFELGGDCALNIDGDGQFSPEDIPKLIAPIVSGEADFATASRFKDPKLLPQMPKIKIWGNRQVSRLISYLTGSKYYDVSCGMRAYGREAILSLNLLEPFSYTHEVFLCLSNKRMRMVEVPLQIRGEREFGKSRVASNLFRYGKNVLKIVFRFYRDFYPAKFFGAIAAVFLLLGLPLLGFSAFHYFMSGRFSPHIWAIFTGAGCTAGGIASFMMGILGDMLHRQRMYLEEVQYMARSLIIDANRRDS